MINILIVEDQKLLLDGIANSLSMDNDFCVTRKLTNICDAYNEIKNNGCDVLLTDICTENNNNSLNYISEIKKSFPEVKIIVMTGLPDISYAERSRENGADSFIYKNISIEEMKTIIKSCVSGYKIFPTPTPQESTLNSLTKQEMKVLKLYCQGYDRTEIGDILSISVNSVKFHIRNILSKTNYSSMSRLAIYIIHNNLISLE
ncbi:MAG: response regulator transcription factor [Erysipelotrichaceae bacterium]|nr:response regulator transcription factor [Erysipelotrichaceae bacterium]